ncbi:MAG TPA: hypothetical protein VKD72_04115 [Gemmataceae bacterium]|nr:hypothetical protein [Gemmataceae bacterium]
MWHWRRALGVGRTDSPGSRRLIRAAAETGAEGIKRREWTDEEREQYRQRAVELDLGRFLVAPRLERQWKRAELRLLGTAPDEEIAARIGRTTTAVRIMRTRLGISDPGGHGWTADELALLGTAPDEEVARRIGRTQGAVTKKRCKLGIPNPFDGRRAEP